nr:MAG: hypothetical protein [Bacteriophage sp.]
MAEYVKREAIMKFPIRKDQCDKEHANEHFIFGVESVLEYVEKLPAADVAPVVHGRWMESGPLLECQSCGEIYSRLGGNAGKLWNYCPNCGAKMDGGVDDEM